MNCAQKIRYSLGKNKFDNQPRQLVVNSFKEFEKEILATRSLEKGQTFFSAAFANGNHTDCKKYPVESCYRLKKLALPRCFMPLDFDGFTTVTSYHDLIFFLRKFRGFGYETWSHKPQAPRARAVLELSRPVTANESMRIGFALEEKISEGIGQGLVKFDKSIYQLEQPIYVAPENANSFIFDGIVLEVDEILDQYLGMKHLNQMPRQKIQGHGLDELTTSLMGKMPPPDETPRQINRLRSMLSFISANCDYEVYRRVVWAILSTGWDCAENIAYDWSVSAPNRFDQRVFDYLISGFDCKLPNHPTLGSIKFLAENGGWCE